MEKAVLSKILRSKNTVFTFKDIALLWRNTNANIVLTFFSMSPSISSSGIIPPPNTAISSAPFVQAAELFLEKDSYALLRGYLAPQ